MSSAGAGLRPEETALAVVRVVVAGLLIIHGVARISYGIVDDFGGFLTGVGFPLGTILAWTVTVVEILGGALLALNRWARVLAIWFSIQLAAGIALVHAPEGWFVVGAGRNGVEYSILLIACLLAIAFAAGPAQGEVGGP